MSFPYKSLSYPSFIIKIQDFVGEIDKGLFVSSVMAASLDSAVSSLLCAEENESIYFDDDGVEEDQSSNFYDMGSDKNRNFLGEEGFLSGLVPLQSEECVELMFVKECEHLAAGDYAERLRNGGLDFKARQEAVDWIGKVAIYMHTFVFL